MLKMDRCRSCVTAHTGKTLWHEMRWAERKETVSGTEVPNCEKASRIQIRGFRRGQVWRPNVVARQYISKERVQQGHGAATGLTGTIGVSLIPIKTCWLELRRFREAAESWERPSMTFALSLKQRCSLFWLLIFIWRRMENEKTRKEQGRLLDDRNKGF